MIPRIQTSRITLAFAFCLVVLASLAGCSDTIKRGSVQPTRSPEATPVSGELSLPVLVTPFVSPPSATAAATTVTLAATPTSVSLAYPESDIAHVRSVRRAIAGEPDCQLPCWWGLRLGDGEHDVVGKLNERDILFVTSRLKDGTIDHIVASETEGGGQPSGGRIDIGFDFSSAGRLSSVFVKFETAAAYASQFWKTDHISSVLQRSEHVTAVRVIRPIPMFKVDRLPVELNISYAGEGESVASLTIASTVETQAYSKAQPGNRCAVFDLRAPEQASIRVQSATQASSSGPPPAQSEVFVITLADFIAAMHDPKPRLCW